MSRRTTLTPLAGEVAVGHGDRNDDLSSWLASVRDGDEGTTARIYAAARPRLLRTALALGVDPDDAADLVQETLWAAHRNLQRFDPRQASFEGWLSLILVRRARNRWRGLVRKRRLLETLHVFSPRSVESGAEAVDARLTLCKLLGGLTRRQREVVALYEIAGLGADEVARVLRISPAGVRSLARDARRRLTEEASRETREALP